MFKTDRFGQRWALDLESTHWVTQRVAAGLLDVSVMTVHNWIRDGKIRETKQRKVLGDLTRKGTKLSFPGKGTVSVIPLREIERLAEERQMFRKVPLSPGSRRAMRAASFNKKKGGDKNADEG